MEDKEILEGYVDHITFHSDNGYTVFTLETSDESFTCTGKFPSLSEGEYLSLSGKFVNHPKYDLQFEVGSYEVKEPEDLFSMERYLGSGAIKGIGPNLAKKIVKKFKKDTFRVIEEEPELLTQIKGISERIAMQVASQFIEKQELRRAMLYLGKYQVPANYAVKIYNEYGEDLYQVLETNPYRLAEDIAGIGFRTADEIALKMGVEVNSLFRIKSGLFFTLVQAQSSGHVYCPKELLFQKAVFLLDGSGEHLQYALDELEMERKVIVVRAYEQERIYVSQMYYQELNVARMLLDMNEHFFVEKDVIAKHLDEFEQEKQVTLDELQREAVYEGASHGITIITGGPGTGKTTIINALLRYFEGLSYEILLAAPTGRAAKRMKETTGYEAQTIHRLLEVNGIVESDEKSKFEKNRENPIEADVLIVDEASMVDISLMYSLLQAVIPGTRFILVGDVNQLPSVGPGNVLRDVIRSNRFPVVSLNHIYRQDEGSVIVTNAHKINAGEPITLDNKSKDFFFMPRTTSNSLVETVVNLVSRQLPGYLSLSSDQVQVLSPMRKGEWGVASLNEKLQAALNPPRADKEEHSVGQTIFRVGDKVMQIKNDYKLEWVVENEKGYELESGTGVFNGDVGKITKINQFNEAIEVMFDEDKKVHYGFNMLDELELAYAVTVHKSQGSEYPAVVIPLLPGPRVLLNRNLLYTGITRAKQCVTIVGDVNVLSQMIQNANEQKRYSGLMEAFGEIESNPLGGQVC